MAYWCLMIMVDHLLQNQIEKNFFFDKTFLFYKIHLSWRKKCFYKQENFFTEKNINGNVKNIYPISEIYFDTENVCVTNKILFSNSLR